MTLRDRLANLTIQRWSLGDSWEALHPPPEGGDWGLTFPSAPYRDLFNRAFPGLAKKWTLTAKGAHGTFFRRISEGELAEVRRFVDAIRPCVIIKDLTNGSVALGYHARKNSTGAVERTELGQLMRDAKPYNETPTKAHRKAGTELAHRLCALVSSMQCYRDIDGFVAVPSSDPKKPFSLPRGFAAALAKHTGKADLGSALLKHRITPQLKKLALAAKVDALIGSIAVEGTKVRGKSIVVVDDLYQSGLTLNYVAEELRAAGAIAVLGLTVVKTLRNDDNVSRIATSATDDDLDDEDLF